MPRRIATLLALALAACAVAAAPAAARTIDVTSTADSGAGSLRASLATAISGDLVHVPAGTYALTSGVLSVPAGVTVAGDGARATAVSGSGLSGVFRTLGANVVLQDLTITGGRSGGGSGVDSNFGLTLHRVAVVDNVSTSSSGGLSVDGTQPLLIDHSLIARNHADNGTGGGISVGSSSTANAIVTSTIAANTSSSAAGGIYVLSTRLLLDGSTLAGNAANGVGSQGGNFRVASGGITLRNTVLATGVATSGANCYLSSGSTLTSLGHNAQDTDPAPDSDCQNGLGDPTDRARLTLRLSPLQNNGGPTDTFAPATASPLVDTGDTANCSATDQRGVPRPQGAGCDVGAVEHTTATLGASFGDGLTTTTATLHATADSIGLGGSARFAYGPTAGYGAFTAALGLPVAVGAQGLTAPLTGLLPGTTYHYQLLVTTPDGTVAGADRTFTTTAAGTAPGGTGMLCRVPRLKGLTLRRAGAALRAAHCRLGRVVKPRARRGLRPRRGLVVRRQSLRAGSRRPAGTSVGVTLGPRPVRRAASRR
ncbi:MAG: choice-of-anchor Q domain-containing protein [Conexibacter sp.]